MSHTKDAVIEALNAQDDVRLFRIDWMSPNYMDRLGLRRGVDIHGYRIVGYTCDPGYTTGDVFSINMVCDGVKQTYAIGMRIVSTNVDKGGSFPEG